MKNFSKNKIATTLVVIATLLLAGVAIFSAVRLYNLRTQSVTPTTPESEPEAAESGWPECNGWETNPNYNKHACREKALGRARTKFTGFGDKSFYDMGLPLPPSGNINSTEGGTDQQWYNWGLWSQWNTNPVPGGHFLSHGTSCGIGPNAKECTPPATPTPTATVTPTPTATVTPTITPTITPTVTLTPTPTATVTPTPTATVTPTPPGLRACTPLTFSISSPGLACLGDQVIYDTNKDGIQDPGEEGVEGVKVELYDSNDDLISETSTNSEGKYLFCNLEPGEYYVGFEIDDKYTISKKSQGGDRCKDSDANVSNGFTDSVTLAEGDNYLCLDALIYEDGESPINTPTPTQPAGATSTPTPTPTPTGQAQADSADLPQAGMGTPTVILIAMGFVLAIFAIVIAI